MMRIIHASPRAIRGLTVLGFVSFMAANPFPALSGGGMLEAQTPPGESRTLAEEDGKALQRWALGLLGELESGSNPSTGELPHSAATERLWALYFLSVEGREWESPALALADSLDALVLPEALHVDALGAALEVIRAKNSRWPPNKLKHLREGLSSLNDLVEAAPEDPAVRYLRLVSCYYLPFFLDQDDLVKEDLSALIRLLPEGREAFSPPVYRGVLRFVLNTKEIGEADRAALEGSLARVGRSR